MTVVRLGLSVGGPEATFDACFLGCFNAGVAVGSTRCWCERANAMYANRRAVRCSGVLMRLRGFVYSSHSHRGTRAYSYESVRSTDSGAASGGHSRGWIAWAAACAACILTAVLAVAFLLRGAVEGNARPSAEMYFNDPTHIAMWTGTRSVAFTFVLHNLASKAYRYQYFIYVDGEKSANRLIVDKALTLGPDQQISIRQSVKPPNLAEFRVSVSLAGSKNTIFFWTQAQSPHSVGSNG